MTINIIPCLNVTLGNITLHKASIVLVMIIVLLSRALLNGVVYQREKSISTIILPNMQFKDWMAEDVWDI